MQYIVLTLTILLFSIPSYAQSNNIAVVDFTRLMSDSKAGQTLQQQLQTKREAFQKEFADYEKQLRDNEKALMEAQQNLTPEEFIQKREEFEAELLKTRKLFQERRSTLDDSRKVAMKKLQDKAIQIVSDLAEEKKLDAVLTRESVIIVSKTMDMTDSVLERLNNENISITLD